MSGAGKYQPLEEALRSSGKNEVAFGFAELEARLGEQLPSSARAGRGWWANRRGAPQSAAWMSAGYHVVEVDLERQQVTFRKPVLRYTVRKEGDRVIWDADLVKALRRHMALNQARFAGELGVRQQTVSEWETGIYAPSRAMCKYLSLVAERAGFEYRADSDA